MPYTVAPPKQGEDAEVLEEPAIKVWELQDSGSQMISKSGSHHVRVAADKE